MSTIHRSWEGVGASAAVSFGTARCRMEISITTTTAGRAMATRPSHSRRPARGADALPMLSVLSDIVQVDVGAPSRGPSDAETGTDTLDAELTRSWPAGHRARRSCD